MSLENKRFPSPPNGYNLKDYDNIIPNPSEKGERKFSKIALNHITTTDTINRLLNVFWVSKETYLTLYIYILHLNCNIQKVHQLIL